MCVEGCGLWVVRWGVLALDVGTLDVEMLGRIGSHRADAISHRACRDDAHHGGLTFGRASSKVEQKKNVTASPLALLLPRPILSSGPFAVRRLGR